MATLRGFERDLESLLAHLIALDYDAIEAYDAAIERLRREDYRAQLRAFRADHARHVRELGLILRDYGEAPPTHGDLKGVVATGKVLLAGLVDDAAVLFAMKTNEKDTNTAYARAVAHRDLPSHVRELLAVCLDDEKRHKAWIEAALASFHAGERAHAR